MPRRNPRILFRRQNNLNVSKEPGCEKKGVMVGPTQPHSPRSSNVQYCWVGPCTWLLSSVSSHLHCSHGQVEVKPLAILQWGKSIYSPFKGQFYLCCLYLYPNWTGKSPAGCISVLLTSRGSKQLKDGDAEALQCDSKVLLKEVKLSLQDVFPTKAV